MLKTLCFYVMILFPIGVLSQGIVQGKVVDGHTQLGLEGVRIEVENSTQVFSSDQGGIFSMNLPYGKYVLRFSSEGYLEKRMNVEVSAIKVDLSIISLDAEFVDDQSNLIIISESELEDDESGADLMSGLLQSSQDIFMRRVAFDFSSAFFKQRGYDSKEAIVLLNGIPMNRIENARVQWSNWGGLNDVVRNQELSPNLQKSDYVFGGLAGSSYIKIRPSLNRKGLRLTTSAGNRSYAGRVMATYNSGKMTNGLAYTLSASRRWATQKSYIDGTLYNAYAVFGALGYNFNNYHSINALGMFSYVKRGKTAPLTRQLIDLKGYQYNPYWGYQNGDVRNSRNRIVSEPIFALSYAYEKENTRLNVDLGYQFGTIGNTRISYAKAQNPEPDYYQNLPSYYINQPIPNHNLADIQRQYFLNNSQLNWSNLYYANSNKSDNSSAFIISNDVNDERTFTANVNFYTPIYENIKFVSGAVYRNIYSDNYAKIDDLLGGSYFMNYDYFTANPYNAGETDMQKKVGDKWNYFYGLQSNVAELFTQLEFSFKKLELFVSGRYHYTDYQREGKFNYPAFKDSFGKGDMQVFRGMSTKAGMTYALTGRHIFQLNTAYINTPQSLRNTYANIRATNALVPNIKNETAYSLDGTYILRMPYFKSRLTGYYTHIENASETNFFYTQIALTDMVSNDFVAQTIENVQKRHFGMEFGTEAQLIPTLKLTAAVAIGQHTYHNNPKMYVSSDEIGMIEIDKVSLKNYRVPNGPQQAYSLGLEYRSPRNYWWIASTANFMARNYIGISAINRTRNFFIDPNTDNYFENIDQGLARDLLKQERLNDVFLVNLVGGKSWRYKGKYINLTLSVNNLFDTKFISGGFEQSRTANYKKMVSDNANGMPTFGPRYFVGYGRTYMANLAVSL